MRLWALLAAALVGAGSTGCSETPAANSRPGRPIQTVSDGGSLRRTQALPAPPPPPLSSAERAARARALKPARRAAERFFSAYVRFLYGEIPAAQVPGVAGQLRSELQQRALRTPAERAARPRAIRVTVTTAGPPLSALATATILVDRNRYQLKATLEPQHGSWTVVAIDN
jgi:hypothetical protein